jgi:hypothetical protein
MQQVVTGVKNRPAEMDMDIIIDTTADTANVQQEQYTELVKLAQVYGPQEVPFDDILEASNLPQKRKIIEKRKSRIEEQKGQHPPVDPRIEADVKLKDANAALSQARAEAQELRNRLEAIGAAHMIDAIPDIDNGLVAAAG